jgi:DNA-binding NtrC family response regulator
VCGVGAQFQRDLGFTDSTPMSVRAMERTFMRETLRALNGHRTQAAKVLGISLRVLCHELGAYQGGAIVKACEE